MMQLNKKVVLITGASSGIGKTTAILLGKAGGRIIVNYLKDAAAAEIVVQEIKNNGGEAIALQADVTMVEEVADMADKIKNEFGAIEIIVNNASAPINITEFENLEWDEFKKHFDVQIRGAFNVIKAALPEMIKNQRGNIINIITTAAMGAPSPRFGGYVTAKSALLGLTRVLAVELGKYNIRANAVSPGLVDTDLTKELPRAYKEMVAAKNPMQRLTSPEDVASAVLFLASDESRFINGVNIPINGGAKIY